MGCRDESQLVGSPRSADKESLLPYPTRWPRPFRIRSTKLRPLLVEALRAPRPQRVSVFDLDREHILDVMQRHAGSGSAEPVLTVTDQLVRGIEPADLVHHRASPEHRSLSERAFIGEVLPVKPVVLDEAPPSDAPLGHHRHIPVAEVTSAPQRAGGHLDAPRQVEVVTVQVREDVPMRELHALVDRVVHPLVRFRDPLDRMRHAGRSRKTSSVPSVDPPSMMMCSIWGWVCLATDVQAPSDERVPVQNWRDDADEGRGTDAHLGRLADGSVQGRRKCVQRAARAGTWAQTTDKTSYLRFSTRRSRPVRRRFEACERCVGEPASDRMGSPRCQRR